MRAPPDNTRYARLAAGPLSDEAPVVDSIGLGDRAADIAAIERALRARARMRRLPWSNASGAAAAAALLVVIGAARRPAPPTPVAQDRPAAPASPSAPHTLSIAMVEGAGASVELAGGEQQATVGDDLGPGARLRVSAGGGVTLALATGTHLDLGSGATAKVVALADLQRFDIGAGTVSARVAKLEPGHRFIIGTPDAEVEVKGTRFEVTVGAEPAACAPAVRTRVTVQEGVVAIRAGAAELRLTAGSRWPDCQPPRAPAAERPAHRSHVVASPAAAVPPQSPEPAPTPTLTIDSASTLADQNDLFAAALAAGRRGDANEAVRWLDRLIARYPTGQLAASARAERRRLIESAGGKASSE
jgi:hypothetical protein